MKPSEKFIDAFGFEKCPVTGTAPLLENIDFKSLHEDELTIPCAHYILAILIKKIKRIQFEIENTTQIINPSKFGEKLLQFRNIKTILSVCISTVYIQLLS